MNVGRPRININWDEFEKLVSYQCTQEEIAHFFGVSVDLLELACKRDLGVSLSDVWNKKKAIGRIKLRKEQMKLLESGGPGAATMAIFLGKQYLGQTDGKLDQKLIDAMMQTGMSLEDVIYLISERQSEKKEVPKISFKEFCVKSGYPPPYEKQIEMFEFGINNNEPRLLLGARGYGKTDYVVICGIAYDIYLNPLSSTNLILTKSRERNASLLREIANCLIANGILLDKQNSNFLRVKGLHGKDHSVSAVTIKTVSLRGRHPKRTILDDPVTEDDVSEATRLHVERVWNELNKLTHDILIIGQPAHKHDLYAKLRPLLKKLEVPWGSIIELDHDLEAQKLAGVDDRSIQMSYHLQVPKDGATPFDLIKYIDEFPSQGTSVAFIDPANKGIDSTALSIMKAHFDGVAVVGFNWHKAWNHCLDDVVPLLIKYGVKKVAIECNNLGDMPKDLLNQLLKNTGIGVVGKYTTTNKHSRIMAAGAHAHLIHLSRESHSGFIKEVVEYEYNSKHDDCPDSLASCLEWIGLIRGK